MAKAKGAPKTGGRAAGVPNKATQDVRACMAMFAENNVSKLEGWLNATAKGDIVNGVKPDPGKAADLFLKAIEYHIPKLGRTELTGLNGGAIEVKNASQLTDDELAAIAANAAKS